MRPTRAARTAGVAVALMLAGASIATAGSAPPGPSVSTPGAYDPAYHGAIRGQSFTVTPLTVTVHDGPTGTHTATLDADLYVPRDATPGTPQPAILQTNGFGLSKTAAEITSTAAFFASHGYVYLAWTAQGFGQSSGCITLDSADYDVKDAEALIDLLAGKPYVRHDARGPIVAILGGSYGGGLDATLAEHDPRIRAIAPGRTWNSLQYALDPNNLVLPGDRTGFDHQLADQGVFKREWTTLFYADGNAQPVGGIPPTGIAAGGCIAEKTANAATDPADFASIATGCTGYHVELCQTYAEILATGDATAAARALLADSSAETELAKLTVPTMLVQGESDTLFNEDDAAATYLALQARGVPVEWIWNSGGHGGYNSLPGECEVYGAGTSGLEGCYLTSRELAWMDRWLRGTAVALGPGFSYYRDWTPPPTGTTNAHASYGDAVSYPAFPALRFVLSGSSVLAAPGQPVTAGSATFLNPAGGEPASYSETSNFSGPDSSPRLAIAPSDPPGESVSFTSPPVAQDVVSVGIPTAHLQLSHQNGQDLVLFAKVFDVAPDGSTTLIHRLVAPVRVPAASVGAAVNLHLLGFAHLFRAGHAIRLTIAATDQAYTSSVLADVVTVTTGGRDPSTFSVPLAPESSGHPVFVLPPRRIAAGPTGSAGRSGSLAVTGLPAVVPFLAFALLVVGVSLRRRARQQATK